MGIGSDALLSLNDLELPILATASVGDEYIMIQEKLTGDEYGLDVMNDLEGRNVGVSVKKKLAMRAGETDKAILGWLRGEAVDSSLLVPQYGKMFSKNDYLMEIR